jgi:predicted phage terminase large subunit-like protein
VAKAKVEFTEHQILASLCRESLFDFVKEFWDCVSHEKPVWNWHIEYLCGELQKLAEGVFAGRPREYDLVINVSPGTTKSTLVSVMFPAWLWTRMPSCRIIGASYAHMLAVDLSRRNRDVIKSDKYRLCFPEIKLREDEDAKHKYVNTKHGDRFAVGAGGSVLGMHGHFIIVDDPLDPEQAASEAELKIVNRWMTQTLPSRKVDKAVAPMVLVHQRLHYSDPTGVILERQKLGRGFPIKVIRLPADDSFPIEPPELKAFYKDGLFDPVRLPRSVLQEQRGISEYVYCAQYGQDPRPSGLGMFQPEYFNSRKKAAPHNSRRIRFWDRASTLGEGAYTAGVLLAQGPDGDYYVEHVVRGQWAPDQRNKIMLATALRDRQRYQQYEPLIFVEREGGSSGRDAWLGVVRALAGFNVREDNPTGKKEVRAEPWSAQLAAGNVHLVEDGSWGINDFIEEHLAFPDGKYKDQVDSAAAAFSLLAGVKKCHAMKVFKIQPRPKVEGDGLRIIVRPDEELPLLEQDGPCLVVHVGPGAAGLESQIDRLELSFGDVEPSDETPYDMATPEGPTVGELMLTRDEAKRLWAFLTRRRPENPAAVVFCEPGDCRRAVSLALAVVDAMRLPRETTLHLPDVSGKIHSEAPNGHVYRTVRASRHLVV